MRHEWAGRSEVPVLLTILLFWDLVSCSFFSLFLPVELVLISLLGIVCNHKKQPTAIFLNLEDLGCCWITFIDALKPLTKVGTTDLETVNERKERTLLSEAAQSTNISVSTQDGCETEWLHCTYDGGHYRFMVLHEGLLVFLGPLKQGVHHGSP